MGLIRQAYLNNRYANIIIKLNTPGIRPVSRALKSHRLRVIAADNPANQTEWRSSINFQCAAGIAQVKFDPTNLICYGHDIITLSFQKRIAIA